MRCERPATLSAGDQVPYDNGLGRVAPVGVGHVGEQAAVRAYRRLAGVLGDHGLRPASQRHAEDLIVGSPVVIEEQRPRRRQSQDRKSPDHRDIRGERADQSAGTGRAHLNPPVARPDHDARRHGPNLCRSRGQMWLGWPTTRCALRHHERYDRGHQQGSGDDSADRQPSPPATPPGLLDQRLRVRTGRLPDGRRPDGWLPGNRRSSCRSHACARPLCGRLLKGRVHGRSRASRSGSPPLGRCRHSASYNSTMGTGRPALPSGATPD